MDELIFHFLNNFFGRNNYLNLIFKFLSVYLIYAIPIFLILYWFFGQKKIALRATLAGLLAWQVICNLIGHFYFRPRPFTELPLREFLFHRPSYSFPSDHAAFLFALAYSFYLSGKKKTGFWLFGMAVLISITRIIVGFHYPLDILAGWGIGLFSAWVLYLIRRPVDRWVIGPLIWLAKKLRMG